MKVLHVIHRYPPAIGGSEAWCREVGQYLASVGDRVRVLTLDVLDEEEYWADLPVEARTARLGRVDWDGGVFVRRCARSLPVPWLHRLVFGKLLDRRLGIHAYGPHSVEMYGRMFREVRAADVVHLHTVPYPHNVVAFLVAKLFRKTVVITPHFHPTHPHYERRCNYWLLKGCDAVFAVSRYERAYLASKGVDPARIIVTGNGIHVDEYAPEPAERVRAALRERHGVSANARLVLFLGRKAEYKGLAVLVEAVEKLSGRHDIALLLAGPSLDWFRSFYERLPAPQRRRILDLGQVDHREKVDLLHAADVLVLPSPHEAFGVVFLEAWACGTPVVGTDNPATAELLDGAGLSFRAGDAGDLASKIEALLLDGALGRKLVECGREKLAQKFRWDTIGAAVRAGYGLDRDRRLRILICSNLFPPHSVGGSEVVAYKHARTFRDLGHDVKIFAGKLTRSLVSRYRVSEERGEFGVTWVELLPEDLGGRTQPLRNERIRLAFARALDEFAPDVVHFHNVAGLSGLVIDECTQRRIPTVMTLHDYWGICFKNLMIKNDGRLCKKGGFDCLGCLDLLSGSPPLPTPVRNAHLLLDLLKIDSFISPSRYLAARFVDNGIPAERMAVIRNGIDLERSGRSRRAGDRVTVGYVGQLVKHKGVDTLLRALAGLPDRDRVQALIVGDGEEAGALKSLCRDLRLAERVTFSGRVDNRAIGSLYERIDLLVVPSIWPENSPVTITEAMARGIPVIASDMGGVGELVEEGRTGFLVAPRDVEGLVAKIDFLLHHPEVREEMGRRAVEKIKEHELGPQVERVLNVYGEMLARPRAPHPGHFDLVLYQPARDWDAGVRDLLYRLGELERALARRVLLCRADLAGDEVAERATLLVIPSDGPDSLGAALRAFACGIPAVVRADSAELRELCRASQAGLFYSDAEELGECLRLLMEDERVRRAMAWNARRFFYGSLSRAAPP